MGANPINEVATDVDDGDDAKSPPMVRKRIITNIQIIFLGRTTCKPISRMDMGCTGPHSVKDDAYLCPPGYDGSGGSTRERTARPNTVASSIARLVRGLYRNGDGDVVEVM